MRKRKETRNFVDANELNEDENLNNLNDSKTSKDLTTIKQTLLKFGIMILIIVIICSSSRFIFKKPGDLISYIPISVRSALNKEYPRLNTSVNISGLPQSLQTHLFCGVYLGCGVAAVCHCPVASAEENFHIYSQVQFPSSIYNFGWQRSYNIGYPPKFNTKMINNNSYATYSKRTDDDWCSTGAGMWARWTKPGYHKCFARIVGERLKFKPGSTVLDMGSGCGHTLMQWTHWFGIFGMGFDFQIKNVEYANNIAINNNLPYFTYHASLQSVYIDNWIPNKSFDYVFSKGVMLYLNAKESCLLIKKTVDILKRNGIAWFGWVHKVPQIKECVDQYVKDSNAMHINHYWINENDTKFLDTCAKTGTQRPSLVIQRLN